jgi:hypothetical protein
MKKNKSTALGVLLLFMLFSWTPVRNYTPNTPNAGYLLVIRSKRNRTPKAISIRVLFFRFLGWRVLCDVRVVLQNNHDSS